MVEKHGSPPLYCINLNCDIKIGSSICHILYCIYHFFAGSGGKMWPKDTLFFGQESAYSRERSPQFREKLESFIGTTLLPEKFGSTFH